MAACPTQHFSAVDRAMWSCIQAEVKRQTGLEIGDSGEASQAGVKMSWSFDEDNQVLRLTCLDKPFLVPCALVHQTANDIAARCRR